MQNDNALQCVTRNEKRSRRQSHKPALLATAFLWIVHPAMAQDNSTRVPSFSPVATPTQNTSGGLGDIVVTAQRRNENLQKVPIAITAVTSEELTSKKIATGEDLNVIVPSLNVVRGSSGINPYIRGVGTNSMNPGVEPPIALYVDGVYQGGAMAGNMNFNNVDHIEVLKGPQGTLFGRNSTGGLINVITREPKPEFSGTINAGYGNYDTLEGNLFVNVPLADNISANFSAYGYSQGEGWGYNFTRNEEVNFRKEYAFRGKVLFTPGTSTRITLEADHSYVNTDVGSTLQPLPNLPPPPPRFEGAAFRGTIYDAIANDFMFNHVKNSGGYLRIEQDIGELRVVSTSSYRRFRRDNSQDLDGTQVFISFPTQVDITDTFSQELQIQSNESNNIQWIAGLYYFYADAGLHPLIVNSPALGAARYIRIEDTLKTNSYSAFAQTTFPIFSDDTQITLGVRYTRDEKSIVGRVDTALANTAMVQDDRNWGRLTYRVAIQQQLTPTTLLYASLNTGFKSGLYNASSPTQAPLNPEKLTAYEAGIKTDLLDRRIRLNLSGFYYDYTDLQLTSIAGGGGGGSTTVTSNAAASRIYGAEVEGQFLATDRLHINYGFSYTHARFTSYPGAPVFLTDPATGVGVQTIVDLSGNHLGRTPTTTLNLGADYTIPTPDGEFGFNLGFFRNGGFYFDQDNQYRQSAYGLVNGEIRWTSNNEKYQIRLWIKNALDKQYYSLIRTGNNQIPYGAPGAPRTFGFVVERRF